MRVRDEGHFHTVEDVQAYVECAVNLAEMVGLEGEDRAALLPKMVELLSAKQVVFDASPTMAIPRLGPGH